MKKYIVITNSGSKKFDGDKYDEAVTYAKGWIPSGIYELITTVSHADPVVIDLRQPAANEPVYASDDPYAVDWSQIGATRNYVTTDQDNEQYAWKYRPQIGMLDWFSADNTPYGEYDNIGTTTTNPDWKSSLRIRPGFE